MHLQIKSTWFWWLIILASCNTSRINPELILNTKDIKGDILVNIKPVKRGDTVTVKLNQNINRKQEVILYQNIALELRDVLHDHLYSDFAKYKLSNLDNLDFSEYLKKRSPSYSSNRHIVTYKIYYNSEFHHFLIITT